MHQTYSSPNQLFPGTSGLGGIGIDFEPLISAEEAAMLFGGMHIKTLQRKAREGEIPGYQIGRSWYFRRSELDAWLRSRVRCTLANPSAA
jgi:excisionase family DNA binding protein